MNTSVILDFNKKKKEYEYKKNIILQVLINYYKDFQQSSGGVNIPYFMEAKKHYKKIIKNNKDVNFYYNKILTYK